ncbi:GAF domain-containing protein [Methylobacterium sp. JK268]
MSGAATAPLAAEAAASRAPARAARRIPLAVKLAIALVGLVTVVLLVDGAVNLLLNFDEAKRTVVRVQQEKARAAAERIDGFVSEIEGQIGWTTRAEWRRVPVEQQRYDFIRLLRQAPAITEAVYIDPAGREQLKVSRLEPDAIGSGRDLSGDPRFVRAVADGLWLGPVTFRRGSEPYMTIAVAHAGRTPGVTVAEVNLKLVWDVISAIRIGERGYAFVVTDTGRLIAHPDLSLVLRDTDLSGAPQVARALAARGAPAGGTTSEITTDMQGREVLSAHAPIARVGWIVFVQSPLGEALAPVYAALTRSLMLLGLGLLLATVAGTFLARRMVVPIRRLQEGAERLGGGDLSQRLAIRTGDEIETLADRFNVMANRLQESYATLEAKVAERTRDLNESLEQQTATAEVLQTISRSAFDLEAVLGTLATSSAQLCAADQGILFLRDGDLFHPRATFGATPGLLDQLRANPRRTGDRTTIAARVAQSGRIEHVPDKRLDPGYAPPAGETALSDTRTLLGVPLLRQGSVEGVLVLMRVACHPFTPRQIELAQTFADQAMIAIENARLFDEVRARTRDLTDALEQQTATSEVLQTISRSAFDLPAILTTLLHSATRLCRIETSALYLLREGCLHLEASTVNRPEWVEYKRAHPQPLSRDVPSSRAAVKGEIDHVPDILADPELTSAPDLHRIGGYRATLNVPLMREGAVIGVLSLARNAPGAFAERQIALAKTFADQAVIAIENARLFEEVQARTREVSESLRQQTATAEALQVISQSAFDLETVLATLIRSATDLCKVRSGMIFVREGGVCLLGAAIGIEAATERFFRETPRTPGRGSIVPRVMLSGAVEQIPDILADEEFALAHVNDDFRGLLGVPLMRDGEVKGVFVLMRPEAGLFSDRQVELVRTFADQAVIAMQNARLLSELQERTRDLQASLDDLRATQDRLVQSEKLASLGQLTAGIAHEIKNPLNFVNNFAALSAELIDELNAALAPAALDGPVREEVDELTGLLRGNLEKVVQHGRRADSIVKNMLLHSREGSGEHRLVDVNALVEESLNLAYHGARAEKPGFTVTLARDLDPGAGSADLYPQEITRVLLNLIANGFYAVAKRAAQAAEAGYEPRLLAATRDHGDRVEILIRDNGTGIPDAVRAKMFNPFFTTKPAGEGTGLGLSLSHDIVVKQHGGTIEVETEPGAFTAFRIVLPRGGPAHPRSPA